MDLFTHVPDRFDDLRIIAGDPQARLDQANRETIKAAADELEQTGRALAASHAALMESRQQVLALTEHISSLKGQSEQGPIMSLTATVEARWP